MIVSSDKLVARLSPPVPLELLEYGLGATVGVVEHGLFPAAMVATVVVARGEQVEIRELH